MKNSLIKKTFLYLFIFFLVAGALDYFALPFIGKYIGDYAAVAVDAVYALAVFIMIVFVLYKPLKIVFCEMKAMLTGHPYKKIFTKRVDEVGVLAHFFNEVTRNIERISVDVEESRRMSKELSIGSDIQRKILPKVMPEIFGISLYGSMRPASEVGGDSFDIIPAAGNNTLIYVGDVTGHGLPAALIMVMVNTMIRTLSEINTSGYDIILNTNRILKQRIEPRRFMTCVLLRWNSQEQKLYYTGAGHEHILIHRKSTGKCEIKQTGGIALGMVPDISKIIREEPIPLQPEDYVVLYSDGIIEAKNMQGEMFGLQRLQAAVEQYASISSPEELFRHVSKDFGLFVGEQNQEDDITLIALKKT